MIYRNNNNNNLDVELKENENSDEYNNNDNNNNNNNDDKGNDWLPVSQTIRFDETSLTPIMKTQYSHSLENLGDIKADKTDDDDDDDDDDNDDNNDDKNISYLDWTNYAINYLQFAEEENLEFYSNKELFIVLSNYVLIYSKPGDQRGFPQRSQNHELSIIGILNKYDLVLIAAQQRDYTTECYVRCLLPIEGWIYLPQSTVDKWINSDKMTISSHHQLNLSTNYSSNNDYNLNNNFRQNSGRSNNSSNDETKFYQGNNFHEIDLNYIYKTKNREKNKNNKNRNRHIWKKLEDDINHINFLDQQIVPLTHPLPKHLMKEKQDDDNDNDEKKHIKIEEEEEKEEEGEKGKCAQRLTDLLNWIVRWMRAHPYFPGLAITIIQAIIEVVIFFDVITDLIVCAQLGAISNTSFILSTFYTLSVVFFLSPYMIGWVATTQWMLRKLQKRKLDQERSKISKLQQVEGKFIRYLWKMAFILFNIAPIGIFTLFIGDIIHLIEYFIFRPIAYLSSCLSCCNGRDNDNNDINDINIDKEKTINNSCCKLRTISFEELGYWKLRRVSEIFAETIPQSVLQLLLLLLLESYADEHLDISTFSVVIALLSSVVVCLFWIIILLFESKTNGMSFVEYVTVVFQGSFKFVPYLPAIERGKRTGINVNWTRYRLDVDGLGLVAKSLISPNCVIEKLKISLYTIEKLHRNACKYFGKTIYQYNKNGGDHVNLELIITRQESDIKHLFEVYDIDDNYYFDFLEFARCCLVMRKDVKKTVNLYTVSSLFYELIGNNHKNEIYLLDLLFKMGSSKNKIPLLDYDNTLYYATKNNHLNLISLLISTSYHKYNYDEFEKCVIHSIINKKKEKTALTLCEDIGIPIVIEILSAKLNKICNPFVTCSIFNIEMKTKLLFNKKNPNWNKMYLLFIIPFNQIDNILTKYHKHNENIEQQIIMSSPDILQINRYNHTTKPLIEQPTISSMNAPRPMIINNEESSQNEKDKFIINETEKQIDLLIASEKRNKNNKNKNNKNKNKNKKSEEIALKITESAIFQEIEYLSEHEDNMNEYKNPQLYDEDSIGYKKKKKKKKSKKY